MKHKKQIGTHMKYYEDEHVQLDSFNSCNVLFLDKITPYYWCLSNNRGSPHIIGTQSSSNIC